MDFAFNYTITEKQLLWLIVILGAYSLIATVIFIKQIIRKYRDWKWEKEDVMVKMGNKNGNQ